MKHSLKIAVIASILIFVGAGVFAWQKTADTTPLHIALGDSVAAGLGLGNVTANDGCGRTESAYPNLIAQEKGYELVNLACSGATITEGINGDQKTKTATIPSQLSQLSSYKKPELITVTIGANDIDWTGPIIDCFIALCGTENDTKKVTEKLTTLEQNLKTALSEIQKIYNNTPPKVIVTTYYSFTSTAQATCQQFTGVSENEASWLAQQATKLNDTIKNTASSYAFTNITEISFDTNGLCDQTSWIQGPRDSAPFHPTLNGQQAIKDAILRSL